MPTVRSSSRTAVAARCPSAFLNSPQYIGAFTASYTYQDAGGGGADGCAFVLQNAPNGAAALGGGGGGLGYSGVTPSVAVEFNIYSANTVGMAVRNETGANRPHLHGGTGSSEDWLAVICVGVTISYNGMALSVTLTDSVSHVSFVTNTSLNIPVVLGTNTAYASGLTGADGGTSSTQVVSKFFNSRARSRFPARSPEPTRWGWGFGRIRQGASLAAKLSFQLSTWVSATNVAVVNSNGINQAVIQPQDLKRFLSAGDALARTAGPFVSLSTEKS